MEWAGPVSETARLMREPPGNGKFHLWNILTNNWASPPSPFLVEWVGPLPHNCDRGGPAHRTR